MSEPSNRNGRRVTLAISGMTCNGCVNTVKRILSGIRGTVSAEVDLDGGRAEVDGTARADELIAALQGAGFGAQLSSDEAGGRNP